MPAEIREGPFTRVVVRGFGQGSSGSKDASAEEPAARGRFRKSRPRYYFDGKKSKSSPSTAQVKATLFLGRSGTAGAAREAVDRDVCVGQCASGRIARPVACSGGRAGALQMST